MQTLREVAGVTAGTAEARVVREVRAARELQVAVVASSVTRGAGAHVIHAGLQARGQDQGQLWMRTGSTFRAYGSRSGGGVPMMGVQKGRAGAEHSARHGPDARLSKSHLRCGAADVAVVDAHVHKPVLVFRLRVLGARET